MSGSIRFHLPTPRQEKLVSSAGFDTGGEVSRSSVSFGYEPAPLGCSFVSPSGCSSALVPPIVSLDVIGHPFVHLFSLHASDFLVRVFPRFFGPRTTRPSLPDFFRGLGVEVPLVHPQVASLISGGMMPVFPGVPGILRFHPFLLGSDFGEALFVVSSPVSLRALSPLDVLISLGYDPRVLPDVTPQDLSMLPSVLALRGIVDWIRLSLSADQTTADFTRA